MCGIVLCFANLWSLEVRRCHCARVHPRCSTGGTACSKHLGCYCTIDGVLNCNGFFLSSTINHHLNFVSQSCGSRIVHTGSCVSILTNLQTQNSNHCTNTTQGQKAHETTNNASRLCWLHKATQGHGIARCVHHNIRKPHQKEHFVNYVIIC